MLEDIMFVIGRYTFLEQWNVPLLVMLLVCTYYYFKIVKKIQTSYTKKICFLLAIVLFYLVSGTPFSLLSKDYLFSFKMLKESTLYFAVPLLFIQAIPGKALQRLFWNYRFKTLVMTVTNPFGALVVFYMFYSFYHLPSLFSSIMSHPFYNGMYEALLFVLAFFMWWSIISPIPGINHLSDLKKAVYVLINSLVLFIPMYPLAFLEIPNYRFIGHELSVLHAKEDFKLGTLLIFIYQKVVVCIIFAAIFNRWFKREDKIDPIDVSGALGVRNLTKK